MIVKPMSFASHPAIQIIPNAQERALLQGRAPTAMDWLAQLVATTPNAEWECNASNVFETHVVYVPRWLGFVRPQGAALEESLRRLLADMVRLLEWHDFTVNAPAGVAS